MRILHLDEQMGWRGGELQASWLMQGLVRAGHEVCLSAREGSRFLNDLHGDVRIERVPMPLRSELDLRSAWKLAKLVRVRGIDIVHAHTSHTHTLALLCQWFSPGVKVVVHRRVGFAPKGDALNRWKYRAPDRIVCVSGMVRDVLRNYGVPEEKLRLVHSAVELKRLEAQPASRAELGIPEDAVLYFNAGALVGHKDHANLIAAFEQVHARMPDSRLLIAGEGELRPQLEAQISRAGLGRFITLLGHRSDVPAITRAADVYVSSSWSEGLGTSVLEALGCGTPVVATEAGGASEMVKPGETGLLVPCRDAAALANAMLSAQRNRADSERMSSAARRLVAEQFSVEKMVVGNLAVYEELLG